MNDYIQITPISYDRLFTRRKKEIVWTSDVIRKFNEFLLDVLDELEEKELTFHCGVRAMDFLQMFPNFGRINNRHYLESATCTIWLELDFTLHSKTIKCGEIVM